MLFIENMETFRRLADIDVCFYDFSLTAETGPVVGCSLLDDSLTGGGP